MNTRALIAWLMVVLVVGSIDTGIAGFIGHRVSDSIQALADAVKHTH